MWQSIETAPKDGTEVIYQDSDGRVSTCAWQADDCGHSWYDIHGDQLAYPRRWMALPKRLPLSKVAQEARRPPAPALLLGADQERPNIPAKARVALAFAIGRNSPRCRPPQTPRRKARNPSIGNG